MTPSHQALSRIAQEATYAIARDLTGEARRAWENVTAAIRVAERVTGEGEKRL